MVVVWSIEGRHDFPRSLAAAAWLTNPFDLSGLVLVFVSAVPRYRNHVLTVAGLVRAGLLCNSRLWQETGLFPLPHRREYVLLRCTHSVRSSRSPLVVSTYIGPLRPSVSGLWGTV
jgi:hypothetical protein